MFKRSSSLPLPYTLDRKGQKNDRGVPETEFFDDRTGHLGRFSARMWRRCHFLIEIDSGRSLSLKEVDSGVWLSVCPNLVNIWAANFTVNQKIRIGKGFTTGSDEVSADKIHQNRAEMPEDFAGTVVKKHENGHFCAFESLIG